MNWKHAFLACGVLGVFGTARADIKYTTEMTMDGGGQETPKTITVRAVKPNFERSEYRQQIGAFKMNHITIRVCDKKHTIKLDSDLKIYTIEPDYKGETIGPDGKPLPADPNAKKTGKMTMTYAVQDLGEEMVAGFKTRHYMIETEIESSGCAGDGKNQSKQEIWVSDIRDANPCPPDASFSISDAMSRRDCKIDVQTKGDYEKYMDIHKGLVLRQKLYNGDKVLMTTEVTMLSQAKIEDDSLFTVPADYKQVSAEEFQQAQSQAMIKGMTGG